MKKKLIFIISLIMFSCKSPAFESGYISFLGEIPPQNTKCIDKNILSNVLNLTEEQLKQNKEYLEMNDCSELYKQLSNEKKKLESINQTSICQIAKQKKKIKKIKKNIIKEHNKNDKNFKKTLTRKQKSKYSMIKKLNRIDLYREEPNYYNRNPQMPKFGNP